VGGSRGRSDGKEALDALGPLQLRRKRWMWALGDTIASVSCARLFQGGAMGSVIMTGGGGRGRADRRLQNGDDKICRRVCVLFTTDAVPRGASPRFSPAQPVLQGGGRAKSAVILRRINPRLTGDIAASRPF
jgi:hypothetical protein